MKEIKNEAYFQAIPSKEVSDLLLELGQRIKKEFNEPLFGEMIIINAMEYRLGITQERWMEFQEFMAEQSIGIEEEILDDMAENFEVDKEKIH